MKVGKVRDGEKFVLDDRGGVWERTGCTNNNLVIAKCFFGPQDLYGTEIDLNPNAYCYVIFEGPKPFGREAAKTEVASSKISGMKIKIIDELNDVLIRDIFEPTCEQISILSASDTIRITPHGKRKPCVYHISEFAYDFDADTFFLLVMPEREENKDENEEDKGNGQGNGRDEGAQPGRRRAAPKTRSV